MLTYYKQKSGNVINVSTDTNWQKDISDSEKLVLKKKNNLLIFHPSKRLIINLIGTSGSGKGTQGQKLSQIYGIPHISVGDLFRDEWRRKTEVSKLDSLFTNSYAPDELCLGIISKRLAAKDCKKGFILDGFPRTPGQALVLTSTFMRPSDIHIPIYMDLNESIIKNRLQSRFICPECGHQVRGHDACKTGYCPQPSCKNVILEHRKEDIDELKLQRKFDIFNENKLGILSVLEEKDKVVYLKLTEKDSVEMVFDSILQNINQHFDQLCLKEDQKENVVDFPSHPKQDKESTFTSLYNTLCKNKGLLLFLTTSVFAGAVMYSNKKKP